MAELLHIEEPARPVARPIPPPAAPPPEWKAFLELGFRPLYLAGCLWAAVSVALWVYAPQLISGTLGGVLWHAHEMLWGFVATIAVGFLLTAGHNWTGINPLKGRPLAALCVLWLLARAGFLLGSPARGVAWFWLALVCELAFYAWAALAMARAVYPARSRRNYGMPVALLGLGVTDGLYLLAARGGDYALVMPRFNAGLLCMAVIALLVARRVIPFFAMRAIPGLALPMHTRSGQLQLGAGVLAIGLILLGLPLATAAALTVTGLIGLLQLLAWKPWAVRHQPLLWILYVGYAAIGVGLLVAAAHTMGWIARGAWPAHVMGMAGFSVLIIGMVTRTALGHLGRPLQTDRNMLASYALVMAAAVLRLVALLPAAPVTQVLHAAALAWIAGFGLYLWRFFPMMIRPCRPPSPSAIAVRPPVARHSR